MDRGGSVDCDGGGQVSGDRRSESELPPRTFSQPRQLLPAALACMVEIAQGAAAHGAEDRSHTAFVIPSIPIQPGAAASPSESPSNPSLPAWLTDFTPRRWLRNGHLQTLVGNYLPRPRFLLQSVAEYVVVDPC